MRTAAGHATNVLVTTGTGDSIVAAKPESFASDWQALRADHDIQFAPVHLPEQQPPPEWLRALGEFLSRLFGEQFPYLIPLGFIFIVMIIFLPQGLLGFARRWLNR